MNATSTEHTVTLHGHTFSYSDSGSGPALLFIHGLLGSQRQWTHLVDRSRTCSATVSRQSRWGTTPSGHMLRPFATFWIASRSSR